MVREEYTNRANIIRPKLARIEPMTIQLQDLAGMGRRVSPFKCLNHGISGSSGLKPCYCNSNFR